MMFCGLDDNVWQIDYVLEWLYGCDFEWFQCGECFGGLGGLNFIIFEWINSIYMLFLQQVIEWLESDVVLCYGIEDVVMNFDVLECMQFFESLLCVVLYIKYLMNFEVLVVVCWIVCQVVEEIMV